MSRLSKLTSFDVRYNMYNYENKVKVIVHHRIGHVIWSELCWPVGVNKDSVLMSMNNKQIWVNVKGSIPSVKQMLEKYVGSPFYWVFWDFFWNGAENVSHIRDCIVDCSSFGVFIDSSSLDRIRTNIQTVNKDSVLKSLQQ